MWSRRRQRHHRRAPLSANEIIPLSELEVGENGIVVDLDGGSWVLGRMTSLGFTPGAVVSVLQNRGHGPLLARVRDVRVALGRHQARKVLVRRVVE